MGRNVTHLERLQYPIQCLQELGVQVLSTRPKNPVWLQEPAPETSVADEVDEVYVRVNHVLAVPADSITSVELTQSIVQGGIVVTSDNTLLTAFCGNTPLFPPRNLLRAHYLVTFFTQDASVLEAQGGAVDMTQVATIDITFAPYPHSFQYATENLSLFTARQDAASIVF